MGKTNNLTSYIKVGKCDLQPATPRLFLQVSGRPRQGQRLSLTLPYVIDFTIRRSKKDGSCSPCVFRWQPRFDAPSDPDFILLHHTATNDGIEPCEVDYDTEVAKLPKDDPMTRDKDSWDDSLWELSPGGEAHGSVKIPEHYYHAMQAGETYTLLFAGGEVTMWDWGTRLEHLDKDKDPKARHQLEPGEMHPALMIPGGTHISLVAYEEEMPWPERAACLSTFGFDVANTMEKRWREQEALRCMRVIDGWPLPLGPKDRVPGAPILNVTVEGPPTVTTKGLFDINIKVTYTGQVCGPDGQTGPETTTRPITFRSWSIIGLDGSREGFRLYRRRGGKDDVPWEYCVMDDGSMGCQIHDLPDIAVRVAEHEDFTTLRPGETWTTTTVLQGQSWSCFPDDIIVGELFLYGFNGVIIDWWDWGGAEEHAETVVMLPCYTAGRVTDPQDNGGRPKLVVTHSEPVKFRLVE